VRFRFCSFSIFLALSLSGCGSMSKQEMTQKTANVSTKAELEKMLGKPGDFNKIGPMETWTYKASDGDVTFVIMGDKVTLQAAGGNKK
jgi:hypothetical protein